MIREGTEPFKKMSERITWVDVARGIAAILVVLGHSIQVVDSSFDKYILFRVIYSFHMPLFMFLSGFVSYKPNKVNNKWIVERAKNLVIPFIVWTILPVLFSGNTWNIFGRLHEALKQPDISFWFLIILFYCNVLLFFQMNIEQVVFREKNRTNLNQRPSLECEVIGVLSSILIVVLTRVISYKYPGYGLTLLAWHCPFFFTGYWLRRSLISVKVQKFISFILACVWLPLVVSWSRVRLPDYILNYATQMTLTPWQFEIVASIYNYIVAFAGIGFSILISMYLSNIEVIRKLLSRVGIFTVEIYLMQGLFYNIIRSPYIYLNIICNMVLGGSMPLIVCYLIEQEKMRKLLFGKNTTRIR